MTERVETTCPACAEPILAAAKKCRHCGAVVAEARARYSTRVCPACAETTESHTGRCTFCAEALPGEGAVQASAGPVAQPWRQPEPARPSAAQGRRAAPVPPPPFSGGRSRSVPPVRVRVAPPLEVSFADALPLALSNYANFDGRATRGEYWWFVLVSFLLNFAASWLGVTLFGLGSSEQVALYWIVVLILAVPGFSVLVRRLHDTGRSGLWWMLSLTIIGAIPLLLWLCDDGDVRPNAYGPPRTA